MNFAYGVIAAVGVLVAISVGFIMTSPDEVIGDYRTDDPVATVIIEEEWVEPEDLHASVLVPVGTASPGCEADNSCYLPYDLTVPIGTTVTWTVEDTAAHTITSGTPRDGMTDVFDSGLLAPKSQFEHTFEEYGTYDYYCVVHPWMTGVVTVGLASPDHCSDPMCV